MLPFYAIGPSWTKFAPRPGAHATVQTSVSQPTQRRIIGSGRSSARDWCWANPDSLKNHRDLSRRTMSPQDTKPPKWKKFIGQCKPRGHDRPHTAIRANDLGNEEDLQDQHWNQYGKVQPGKVAQHLDQLGVTVETEGDRRKQNAACHEGYPHCHSGRGLSRD
ncbi:MFS multidrug transporter [Aspergillus luchuensis]|uniref:MFS multidrug transporter n=1 Tax=Aspergillus kawachii TaxID=1069201 RepID=A0A146FY77_ASPKA|nr:MFS multidrug transporter [Aspergillus luchuensis]